MDITLNMYQASAIAIVVLYIGEWLKSRLNVLEKYCIPAPVVGGIIFAVLNLIFKSTGVMTISIDDTLEKFFMTAFFTTVGFTASFKLLKKGGIQVILFLVIALALVVLQNVTGVTLAKAFDLNPLIGLSTGSTPMTGGHGTSGAFGPVFEEAGAIGASTVALASATFGLIMGSMIGGPIAKRLIDKNNLLEETGDNLRYNEEIAVTEEPAKELSMNELMSATAQIFIAMGIGTIISMLFEKAGKTFPPYLGAMFSAAIIRNIGDASSLFDIKGEEIDIIGNISLSLFLAMALMALKLWELAALAIPLIVMLIAQTVLMALFAYFITFNVMGRDYEAAVMAGGHCGFGMGATPNAMANMQAISSKYGYSPRAFFVVPLVGSLFIDFFNAGIINFFMNIFVK